MAAGIVSKPGSKYSHCEEDCNHRDCAELRQIANSLCNECGKKIGYETRYYYRRDEFGYAHARCLE